jgi:hypothetical protein
VLAASVAKQAAILHAPSASREPGPGAAPLPIEHAPTPSTPSTPGRSADDNSGDLTLRVPLKRALVALPVLHTDHSEMEPHPHSVSCVCADSVLGVCFA